MKPGLSSENRVDLLLEYNNISRNFAVLYKLSSSAAHGFAHYFQTPWRSRLRAISDTRATRLQYDGKVVQSHLVQHHVEAAAQLTVTESSCFCSYFRRTCQSQLFTLCSRLQFGILFGGNSSDRSATWIPRRTLICRLLRCVIVGNNSIYIVN